MRIIFISFVVSVKMPSRTDLVKIDARRCLSWVTRRCYMWDDRLDDWMLEDLRWHSFGVSPKETLMEKTAGTINITNLANPYSAVCSGLTGLLFSGIVTVSVSLMGMFFIYFCARFLPWLVIFL